MAAVVVLRHSLRLRLSAGATLWYCADNKGLPASYPSPRVSHLYRLFLLPRDCWGLPLGQHGDREARTRVAGRRRFHARFTIFPPHGEYSPGRRVAFASEVGSLGPIWRGAAHDGSCSDP